jgi:hypothetical protein
MVASHVANANPANLPVQLSTKFELVTNFQNRKGARAENQQLPTGRYWGQDTYEANILNIFS